MVREKPAASVAVPSAFDLAEAMSVGDTQYRRAVLRGLILHLLAIRRRLYRSRLAAARAWQEEERRRALAARDRIIEQARHVPDPVCARQREGRRAA